MQHWVLLNEAVMCAIPAGIERRRFFASSATAGAAESTSPITIFIASDGSFAAGAGAGAASGAAASGTLVSSAMLVLLRWGSYLAAFFIALRSALSRTAPTVCLAPLRVRALVRVRWPRTGRPLRWRVPR